MNNDDSQDVVISCVHVDLTPALKSFVQQQTDRLFRHGRHVSRVPLELVSDKHRAGGSWFVAKAHVTSVGYVLFASAGAEECQKSVAFLIENIDRIVARQTMEGFRRAPTYKFGEHAPCGPIKSTTNPGMML